MDSDNSRHKEVVGKITKVRQIMESENLAGVLVTQQSNVCWLTAGANNHVLFDYQDSLIGILVTPDKTFVIAENGDHDRVMAEEFSHCPFEYRRIYWPSGGIGVEASKLVKGKVGVDAAVHGIADQVNIEGDIMQYRSVFTDSEIERLKTYGKEAAEIITSTAKKTKPGVSERKIAAMLSEEFVLNGFNMSVILIGGDERSLNFRHQVVTDYKIKKHFCLCGVGKKGGLAFPINRVVSFGRPPKELAENQTKIETVYVYLNSLATVGNTLENIYRKLPDIYKSLDLDSNEWERHTQGGTMGYHPRELTVSDSVRYTLRENNVIGWNPSLPGVMAEDVYLLKSNGLEYITFDSGFPHRELSANGLTQVRPSILEI
jgi:Xaa-Pro aminopeptidase